MVSFGSQSRVMPNKRLVQYIAFFFRIILSVRNIAVLFILKYEVCLKSNETERAVRELAEL